MSKLFWALLAAGRGGFRYLRSLLTAAAGAVFRLKQAPGSDAGAQLGQDAAMDAGMVSRPAADAQMEACAGEAGLLGHMVAWLVSVAYPKFHAGTALLTTLISMSPDSGMRKGAKTETALVTGIRADPDSPGSIHSVRQEGMEAAPNMAPPVPMSGMPETDTALSARSGAGDPTHTTGVLEDGRDLTAGIGRGLSVSIRGTGRTEARISARMMTWCFPVWEDNNTLYIRQVYETQRDGDILILQ